MSETKIIPTYYLISKKKIDPIPISLISYKDSIYYMGDSAKERSDFADECNKDFKNIYSYLNKIGFEFHGVASIEDMNDSLVTEFILKETFDAIFYIEDKEESNSLRFINNLIFNIDYVKEDCEKSSRWLAEMESSVELYANVEIHTYFEKLVEDVEKQYEKLNNFKEISINYLKPNIIKYLKID